MISQMLQLHALLILSSRVLFSPSVSLILYAVFDGIIRCVCWYLRLGYKYPNQYVSEFPVPLQVAIAPHARMVHIMRRQSC